MQEHQQTASALGLEGLGKRGELAARSGDRFSADDGSDAAGRRGGDAHRAAREHNSGQTPPVLQDREVRQSRCWVWRRCNSCSGRWLATTVPDLSLVFALLGRIKEVERRDELGQRG